MKHIWIVGFPKSGNTFLTRLMGDVLDATIMTGYHERKWKALADDELGRVRLNDNLYQIHQAHITTRPLQIGQNKVTVLFVFRDPRDVAVSAMHYWMMPDIETAIERVASGDRLGAGIGWLDYYRRWTQEGKADVSIPFWGLRYKTRMMVEAALLTIDAPVPYDLENIFFNNRIESTRAKIERTPGTDFGRWPKHMQLKNLRKGIVGDWRNYMTTPAQLKMAHDAWGDILLEIGCESNHNWAAKG
jgi:hypothetical protein